MEHIKEFVSRADLHYEGIDRVPEAGIPIGNGRMATLVWMTPSELHMQINRADVFANDATSRSFSVVDSDYTSSCGLIDINFGGKMSGIFSKDTVQYLSVYDGKIVIDAQNVKIVCRALPDQDAFVVEITDEREELTPISVHLRTVRGGSPYVPGLHPQTNPSLRSAGEAYSFIKTNKHLATSILKNTETKLSLVQLFEEELFFCKSHLEIVGYGRKCIAWNRHFSESVLEFEKKRGTVTLVISTAQSFDREDACDTILKKPVENQLVGFLKNATDWWHRFWDQAPLMKMHSSDGQADIVGYHAVYFLYLMACVSRGDYMARYGGLLFYNAGDFRKWGAQYWWHNQSCYYAPLVTLGCYELADPFYNQVWKAREAYRNAARQQWGTQGMYIPETCWFSGPCDISEDLANEMADLYTNKKSWNKRSEAFKAFAEGRNPYESRWNWLLPEREGHDYGPYCYVNHIFSTTAKIAYLFWMRYQSTGDKKWLKERAYPMLKDMADMYVHLPFVQEGEDGYLHLFRVNNHEDLWDATDPISELAAIHGMFPIAVRAAEILGVDKEKREEWRQFEQRMVPLQTSRNSHALEPSKEGEEELWSSGRYPIAKGEEHYYHLMDPVNLYDLVTVETPPSRLRNLAENTYQRCLERHRFGTPDCKIGELDPFVITPGRMGHAEGVKQFVPQVLLDVSPENFCDVSGSGNTVILDNRMTLREGAQCMSAQRIGQATESIANALCQAVPSHPGDEPVLHLFSALPESWDATFRLSAANGYWVEASRIKGIIAYIKLMTSGDLPLVVYNPWVGGNVLVEYGTHQEVVSGERFMIKGSCNLFLVAVNK